MNLPSGDQLVGQPPVGGLRRQQQLLATCPVGIHLVNAADLVPDCGEQNPASVRRPGRTVVASPRIVGEAHVDTARQFVHPDISGWITCVECELCSIRRESQAHIAPPFTSTELFTGAVKPGDSSPLLVITRLINQHAVFRYIKEAATKNPKRSVPRLGEHPP